MPEKLSSLNNVYWITHEIVQLKRHTGKGRPKPGAEKVVTGYQIQARLSTCLEAVRAKKETSGRFILASNQCYTTHGIRQPRDT